MSTEDFSDFWPKAFPCVLRFVDRRCEFCNTVISVTLQNEHRRLEWLLTVCKTSTEDFSDFQPCAKMSTEDFSDFWPKTFPCVLRFIDRRCEFCNTIISVTLPSEHRRLQWLRTVCKMSTEDFSDFWPKVFPCVLRLIDKRCEFCNTIISVTLQSEHRRLQRLPTVCKMSTEDFSDF